MTLNLDATQRINLVAMLDGIEAQGRREAWALCALQSRIELNDTEKDAIGFRRMKTPDGREYAMWNNLNGDSTIFTIDLQDEDIKRICRAVDQYRVVLARDRGWWAPLVDQLPQPEEAKAAGAA